MDNINYENFKNICRMCMLNCDINFTKDAIILDIFHKLTDIHYDLNDELPQQICHKCFDFVNEIYTFSITCKQTHSALMKCLYKHKGIKEELEIKEEIDDEMPIEEHKIEFVSNDWETNDPLKQDELLTTSPILNDIKTENDEESINDFNNESTSLDSVRNNKKTKIKGSKSKCTETSNIEEKRRYKCDECGKSYTKSDKLKMHKRVHTGERPYKCDQCEKLFTQNHHLKRHMRMHSGERPFQCDQCGKTFAHSFLLKSHKCGGEQPLFKCDQCEKTFKLQKSLDVHKAVNHNLDVFGLNWEEVRKRRIE